MATETTNGYAVTGGPAAPVYIVNEEVPTVGGAGGGGSVTQGTSPWVTSVGSALPPGENHTGAVGGHTVSVTGTFNRPADTTAYAANDAVTNSTSATVPISIASAARVAAGSGTVLNARLVKSTTGAAGSGFRLWLFSATPSSPPNDNAALALLAANKATRLGYIDLLTVVTGSDCVEFTGESGSYAGAMPFKLGSGTTLFGLLQTLGAYTPGSAETFDVYLTIYQD